jgi:hypothetical protein
MEVEWKPTWLDSHRDNALLMNVLDAINFLLNDRITFMGCYVFMAGSVVQ